MIKGSREQIEAALFNKFQSFIVANYTQYQYVNEFVTFSRQYIPLEKLPSDQQPAFFLVKGPEKIDQEDVFGPSRYKLHYAVLVFLQIDFEGGDSDQPPSPYPQTVLNNTLDMVDDALWAQGDPQTLGGLVTNAWIDGEVEVRIPITKLQAALAIPVSVLVGS